MPSVLIHKILFFYFKPNLASYKNRPCFFQQIFFYIFKIKAILIILFTMKILVPLLSLFAFQVSSQVVDLNDQIGHLSGDNSDNSRITRQIAKLKEQLIDYINKRPCNCNKVKEEVLDSIKDNGLNLGNRWVIREEGTGSYQALVFRDKNSGGDKRYAMFNNRYTDL